MSLVLILSLGQIDRQTKNEWQMSNRERAHLNSALSYISATLQCTLENDTE